MRKTHIAVVLTAVGSLVFGTAASAQDGGFSNSSFSSWDTAQAFSDAFGSQLQYLFTPPNRAPHPPVNDAARARELSHLRAGYQRQEYAEEQGLPVDYNKIEQYYAVQGQPYQ